MSESSKHQPYKYSMKTVAFARYTGGVVNNSIICTNTIIFYMIPPDGALTIENLYMHLKMRFASGVASGARVLRKVGVIDQVTAPSLFPFASGYRLKTLDLDLVADGNRYIDLRLDLTSLLKKDDVAYRNLFTDDSTPDDGFTMVYLEFDESLKNENNIGEIHIWKTDGLFTTIGIV